MQPRTEITHRATSAAWRILAAVELLNQQHTEKLEADSKILAVPSTRKSRLLDTMAEIIEEEFEHGFLEVRGPESSGTRVPGDGSGALIVIDGRTSVVAADAAPERSQQGLAAAAPGRRRRLRTKGGAA